MVTNLWWSKQRTQESDPMRGGVDFGFFILGMFDILSKGYLMDIQYTKALYTKIVLYVQSTTWRLQKITCPEPTLLGLCLKLKLKMISLV